MSKLSLTFPNVHCNQITEPRDASDQTYFVVLPSLLSKPKEWEDPKVRNLPGVLSEWDVGVQPGNNYRPVLREGRKELLIDVPENTEKLIVCVAMAERDDGSMYDKLVSDPRVSFPVPTEWSDIKRVVPGDITSIAGWAGNIAELLFGVLKDWIGDDLIAVRTFEVDVTKAHGTDYRQFSGSGGDYVLNVEWRLLK